MQTIWFPTPVFVLFRRLVNVVSTLSISHHYLLRNNNNNDIQTAEHGNGQCPVEGWDKFRPLAWLPWLSLAVEEGGESQHLDSPNYPTNPPPTRPPPRPRLLPNRNDTLHQLLSHPLLYDPVRKPRNPIVLCHGLYGFDVRGPESFPMFRQHYWANVLNVLRKKVGAEVIVTGVPGTGSIASRSESMDKLLKERARGREVNFMAHSMGGLDCRYLITHIKPTEYTPVSLTTIGTPHRGSPFMDWCMENIGLGKMRQKEEAFAVAQEAIQDAVAQSDSSTDNSQSKSFPLSLASLPSSFTTLLLSLFDSPAYANLTSTYLNTIFNPATPDSPNVKYFSVAGRISSLSIWHPLWLPKMVLDGFEEKEQEKGRILFDDIPEHQRWGNDGLVTVQSARWGEFLGMLEECDHWALRGARGMDVNLQSTSLKEKEVEAIASSSQSQESGNGNGDGWAFGDWGKFVRAWKREEKKAKVAGAAVSAAQQLQSGSSSSSSRNQDTASLAFEATERAKARQQQVSQLQLPGKEFADDVVNASTEKLSAVFDWIVEQVPTSSSSSTPSSASSSSSLSSSQKGEVSSKMDLERFYVALCRKLYDEGL
ncbi:Alpha/Beta hydrolase protein [Abortiporus biennis]|nr:Alpha/Beta hydrolase protein [Abortiporus biennis]